MVGHNGLFRLRNFFYGSVELPLRDLEWVSERAWWWDGVLLSRRRETCDVRMSETEVVKKRGLGSKLDYDLLILFDLLIWFEDKLVLSWWYSRSTIVELRSTMIMLYLFSMATFCVLQEFYFSINEYVSSAVYVVSSNFISHVSNQ